MFTSLAELVEGSDVVIEGEVVGVQPGRVLGEYGELQLYEVSIRVSRELVGRADETLVLEQDGHGIVATLSSVGDVGIFFLVDTTDNAGTNLFRLASSQGRYRLDSRGKLHGANPENRLVRELEANSIEELRSKIIEAATASKP